MTVRAVLWKYKPRRDGSCNIKLYIHSRGTKKYNSTEFYAHPDEWDDDKGRLKAKKPLATKINAILARLENAAKGKIIGVNNSLIELIQSYVEECKRGENDIRVGTWKQYISHLNRLRQYANTKGLEDISFQDVNMDFYNDFMKHLQQTGCGKAGAGKHIKHLKRFMNIGLERQLHTNTEFQQKSFHAAKVRPMDKIYLSEDEINALAALKLNDRPDLKKELDRFLVSYYMLLRYGDSVKITRANMIRQGDRTFYKNIAEKTGTVSFVPVKPSALKIIERNDYNLSGSTNQEANRKLKQIASMAGISENMAAHGEDNLPKHSLVTTHTARRSAATNLLLSGAPLSEIMQLGGWKHESTLQRYLLAGGIELAQLSAERLFFN